jgi:hypothetical protein
MNGIRKPLGDPVWWFSSFLVGILASLLAGYIRDWTGNLASRFSGRAKAWVNSGRAARKERIEKLVENPALLQMEMTHCTERAIDAFGFVLLYCVMALFFRSGQLFEMLELLLLFEVALFDSPRSDRRAVLLGM